MRARAGAFAMKTPKGQIDRTGVVSFHDASISIWEDSLPSITNASSLKARDAWELAFKRQVFARVVQTLNRIGWTCVVPEEYIKRYSLSFARDRRECRKGDLHGELSVSGRHIEFNMWQDVTPSENPNGGRYDFNKKERMPYALRLEMERTLRRIRDYLCNVFAGYTFKECEPVMGLLGVTAVEKAKHDRMTSGHYKPALDRAEISMTSNAIARDGGTIQHGAQVWALDHKGRVITGTAFYSLNNQWQIVTGRYGLTYCHTGEIFTQPPENLRVKRNQRDGRKRLEQEMQKAVKAMDFKRADVIKRVLFPSGPLYAIYSKKNDSYFAVMYCGYRNSLTDAGKYTRDELKPYLGNALENDQYKAVEVAA